MQDVSPSRISRVREAARTVREIAAAVFMVLMVAAAAIIIIGVINIAIGMRG